MPKTLHFLHRYGGLIVSLQLLLWSLSGFLMAFWSFGDLYVDPEPQALDPAKFSLSPQAVTQYLPPQTQVQSLELVLLADQPVYRVRRIGQPPLLLDPNGQHLSPLSTEYATTLGRSLYLGTGELLRTELLPRSQGNYVSSTPVYRLQFADAQRTEIYLDPNSGQLLARRKALWRWYNRMWEVHLMKYTPSATVNKLLLLAFALLTFVVSLTGLFKFFSRH